MSDLDELRPRRLSFRLGRAEVVSWAEHPVSAHLMNAVSSFLPSGEKFFVEAVRETAVAFDPQSHPALQDEILGFSAQEMSHRRHHTAYNAVVAATFPVMSGFLSYLEIGWSVVRKVSSRQTRLAYTVGIEHVTATLARLILAGADPKALPENDYVRLWLWHAFEELEHRRVAFEVYRASGGGYLRRIAAMIVMTIAFIPEFIYITAATLRADQRLFKMGTWLYMRQLFASPEFEIALKGYLDYFSPYFDPDQPGDGDLVSCWRRASIFQPPQNRSVSRAARLRPSEVVR